MTDPGDAGAGAAAVAGADAVDAGDDWAAFSVAANGFCVEAAPLLASVCQTEGDVAVLTDEIMSRLFALWRAEVGRAGSMVPQQGRQRSGFFQRRLKLGGVVGILVQAIVARLVGGAEEIGKR